MTEAWKTCPDTLRVHGFSALSAYQVGRNVTLLFLFPLKAKKMSSVRFKIMCSCSYTTCRDGFICSRICLHLDSYLPN